MSSPDHTARGRIDVRTRVEDLFRDVPPLRSAEDLASADVFDTDSELEEFLASVRSARDADLA